MGGRFGGPTVGRTGMFGVYGVGRFGRIGDQTTHTVDRLEEQPDGRTGRF